MTPYRLLTPTTSPVTVLTASSSSSVSAKSNKSSIDDSARIARRDEDAKAASGKKSSEAETKSKNDRKTTAASDQTLFGQFMASLLNTPSPVVKTPVPLAAGFDVGPDIYIAGSGSASDQVLAPPVTLAPASDVNTSANPASETGFSAELLAALTPGIPAPDAAQTALMSQIETSVAVKVNLPAATEAPTASLTVNADVKADPRLVACGFDPLQMGKFQDRRAAPAAGQSPALEQSAQSLQVPTENGVISVTFNLPKSQPVVAAAQAQPVAIANTETVALANGMATGITAKITAASSSEVSDSVREPSVLADEHFDPVEFRIAQSFQRPVSPPATPAPNSSVANNSANGSVQGQADIMPNPPAQPQTPHAQHAANLSVNGRMNASAGDAMSSMMPSLLSPGAATLSNDSAMTVSPTAIPVTVSPLTSTVLQPTTAAQSHPAVQAVAAIIARNAKEGGPQTISLRLDPPELGKLQVEMKYKKGEPLKVHVVADKADTASMFSRDSHALESTLKDAGLQMDGSSLSFEFSGDGGFRQALGDDARQTSLKASSIIETSNITDAETIQEIHLDTKTGLTHYNMRV